MGRQPRIQYEGAVYHATTRGNNRERIYRDGRDHELFLVILADVIVRMGWICPAYCLMPNHYHLLIRTPEANLAEGMHMLNTRYAKAFLARHERTGHVFERRYHPVLIQRQEHLLEVCRYVVLNPVRAKWIDCDSAELWRWSSYCATAGLAPCPHFLDADWVLRQFGGRRDARSRYSAFVAAGSPADSLEALLLL